MKVQLDTKRKTIKLEDDINLGEFFTKIKKLLPNDWKEFKLQTQTVIERWNNPIYIEKWTRPYWDYPYYYRSTTDKSISLSSGSDLKATYELKDGLFNVEM